MIIFVIVRYIMQGLEKHSCSRKAEVLVDEIKRLMEEREQLQDNNAPQEELKSREEMLEELRRRLRGSITPESDDANE